jgi:hypothetical protein
MFQQSAIVDAMRPVTRRPGSGAEESGLAVQVSTSWASGHVSNRELIAMTSHRVPPGVTLWRTVATPAASSAVVYCMGVAANNGGLGLPVSVLGASTAPSFPSATAVTGMVVLCFTRDGSKLEQCTLSRVFTVGG